MYLKQVDGPRAVTLPDGKVFSRADLPPPDTARWVASRKLSVVQAIAFGLITRGEAMRIYALSEEELYSWTRSLNTSGKEGLKATSRNRNRQP